MDKEERARKRIVLFRSLFRGKMPALYQVVGLLPERQSNKAIKEATGKPVAPATEKTMIGN